MTLGECFQASGPFYITVANQSPEWREIRPKSSTKSGAVRNRSKHLDKDSEDTFTKCADDTKLQKIPIHRMTSQILKHALIS